MQKALDRYLLTTRKRIIFPIVWLLGLIAWFILCQQYYESYWNGTIRRVQTTDFNILHHTLPTTLSELIVAGQDDAIQKVLDSSYGLFGLVVTDPSGQTVLYRTNKVYHRESWQHLVTPEDLDKVGKEEPFDLLTDPPPLEPVWGHSSPREDHAVKEATTVSQPPRRILGHLYYLRPSPPTYLEDLGGFFSTGMFEMSGSKRGYLGVAFIAVLVCSIVSMLIWFRMRVIALKQTEVDYIARELEIRKKALEHVTAELAAQKSRKAWLEQEADQAYKRALSLKQALEKLRDSLHLVGNVSVASQAQGSYDGAIKVRPAVHPPSALLQEIEDLIPTLTDNAGNLRSQASLLHDYCAILEQKQAEMKKIVDSAYLRTQQLMPENNLDMTPR